MMIESSSDEPTNRNSRQLRRSRWNARWVLLLYWLLGGCVTYWVVSRAPAAEVPALVGVAIVMAIGMPLVVVAGMATRRSRAASRMATTSLVAGFLMIFAGQSIGDGIESSSLIATCSGIALALYGAVIVDRRNGMP